MSSAFVPGYPPTRPRLLARFLPPLAEGVAAHFVEAGSRPGDLVLDPFGQAPQVALEALQLGRRVVVANFNPVSRLALSLMLRPPPADDLRAALTLLADAPRGGLRLEAQVRGLYATTCADCGAPASADWFEWDAERGAPVEKFYLCQNCGEPAHRRPASPADVEQAARFARGRLADHWLLERVAGREDPDRKHAEEALEVYPPRTLEAIAAILVRLEQLKLPAETRRLVAGLLVAALDTACVLTQERPKALTVPPRYREVNFWLALENSVGTLAGTPAASLAANLPDLLTRGDKPGIHPFAGPVRDLAPSIPPGACTLILTAIPRPNQAYWTLSALWSAWLWGRESAAALRSVLRRRRYDWAWHSQALESALASVRPVLAPTGRMVGLVPEAEPGLTAGLLLAADRAGFQLQAAVLRADTAEAQLAWAHAVDAPPSYPLKRLEDAIRVTARQGAEAALLARGEPSHWASVHLAAWCGLARQRLLAAIPDDPLNSLNHLLEPVFRDARTFQRAGAEAESDLTTGRWYLPPSRSDLPPAAPSLADRVEQAVLALLVPGAVINEHELMHAVHAAFPDTETPGRQLLLACLASYAVRVGPDGWQLRPEDQAERRAEAIQSVQAELRGLAVRHGYQVAGTDLLEWQEAGQTIYLFDVTGHAHLSRHLLGPRPSARRRFLVLPGGRAGLAAFKLRRDPRLRQALMDGNWVLLKFRQVHRMAGDHDLTRATLEPAFSADPLDEARQLALLPGGGPRQAPG